MQFLLFVKSGNIVCFNSHFCNGYWDFFYVFHFFQQWITSTLFIIYLVINFWIFICKYSYFSLMPYAFRYEITGPRDEWPWTFPLPPYAFLLEITGSRDEGPGTLPLGMLLNSSSIYCYLISCVLYSTLPLLLSFFCLILSFSF